MQGFARNKCEMQPKHVLNETDASRCSEQPRQTAHSISMELVSLWDRDRVLYSMASHCCFQQTVHHYSLWQDSKHCAFTWVKKKAAPLLLSLSPFILMSLCFPLFSCFPVYVRAVSLPLFLSVLAPAALQSGRMSGQTFRKTQLCRRFLFA